MIQDETSTSTEPIVLNDMEKVEKEMDRWLLIQKVIHCSGGDMRDKFSYPCSFSTKYLCICGTSVPSECLFSKSGFIVNEFRSRLKPECVDKLVFLARNMS